jgi:hypothetical protein
MKPIPLFVVLALLVVGCDVKVQVGGAGANPKTKKLDLKQPQKDAEAVVTAYFQAIATNGYAEAAGLFGEQAFQTMSREQWLQLQPEFVAKRGSYVSHKFKRSTVRLKTGTPDTTTTVAVECQVTYTQGDFQKLNLHGERRCRR